jgi:hypothetical protein
MLQHAHLVTTGGLRTFAAGARYPSRGVGSRRSGHPKLGLTLRCRKSASSPSAFVAHAYLASLSRKTELDIQTAN